MATLSFRSLVLFGLSFGPVIWTMGSALDAQVNLLLDEIFFFKSSLLSTIFSVEFAPFEPFFQVSSSILFFYTLPFWLCHMKVWGGVSVLP
jgi:hypothetical protein